MKQQQKILGYNSIILDSLRILAALTVFFFHFFYHWFNKLTVSGKIDRFAHAAVIVFFVLSGYLIAYTTTINNRGGVQYLQARFSRLYSVVLPALIITVICELIVGHYNPAMLSSFTRGLSWPRYIMSGLFLNEIWFFSAAPPMNAPLWSLSFECWYYIIFGLFFFRKTGLLSYVLPIAACLIAGPKILIMMPIWLIGYFAYRFPPISISKPVSWIAFIICFALTAFIIIYVNPLPFKLGSKPLYFAGQFFTDWMVGICIGFALWVMPKDNNAKQSNIIGFFRIAGDLTFPLYVLHNPLLILWDAIFVNRIHNIFQLWQPILTVLAISIIIGFFLEKQRYLWVRFFKYLISKKKLFRQ